MTSNIKYPIAFDEETKSLVNAKDAKNGLNKCKCFECNEYMIAYNGSKVDNPYFGHQSGSLCKANYESFVHWLCKEIFHEIDYIDIPPIELSDSLETYEIRQKIDKELVNLGFPKNTQFNGELILQASQRIQIDSFEKEKQLNSEIGSMRADIIILINDQSLLIEPYLSHGLEERTLKVIQNINYSSLSIRLLNFNKYSSHDFSIDEFKNFIQHDLKSKKWENIRTEKLQKLQEKFIQKVKFDFSERKDELIVLNNLVDIEKQYHFEINELIQKQVELQNGLKNIHFKVTELTKKLDVEVSLTNMEKTAILTTLKRSILTSHFHLPKRTI